MCNKIDLLHTKCIGFFVCFRRILIVLSRTAIMLNIAMMILLFCFVFALATPERVSARDLYTDTPQKPAYIHFYYVIFVSFWRRTKQTIVTCILYCIYCLYTFIRIYKNIHDVYYCIISFYIHTMIMMTRLESVYIKIHRTY